MRNAAWAGVGALAAAGWAPKAFGGTAKERAEVRNGNASVPVAIPDVAIRMRSLDSFLVGVTSSDEVEIRLADVLKFHGYCAAGVALAFREAQEAFRLLYGDRLPLRQGIKVQTAYHCCQAGALAYITGARTDFGALVSRGDLALIPAETKKVVFIDKKTGKSVTLLPLVDPHAVFSPLFQKVRKDHGIAPQVQKLLNETVQNYINSPPEKLFTARLG